MRGYYDVRIAPAGYNMASFSPINDFIVRKVRLVRSHGSYEHTAEIMKTIYV